MTKQDKQKITTTKPITNDKSDSYFYPTNDILFIYFGPVSLLTANYL